MEKCHRAFGVYGMYEESGALLVMKKTGGPYINRYDLPGGSLEDGEALEKCVAREFLEETGRTIEKCDQVGTFSFTYPWDFEVWHQNQHIGVFYHVRKIGADVVPVEDFVGQDSVGGVFIPLSELNLENASPLVLKAKEFFVGAPAYDRVDVQYDTWHVLDKPVY